MAVYDGIDIFNFACASWQAAGNCGLEPVTYEFFTQAFLLYEEEISVSDLMPVSFCSTLMLVQKRKYDDLSQV